MKKVILFIAVVSLATTLVLILLNSAWVTQKVRSTLIRIAKKSLNADITIDTVSFGLFPPSVELTGLSLQPLLTIPKFRLVLSPLQLFVGKITIQEVSVTGLQGRFSFVDGKPRLPFEPPFSSKKSRKKSPITAISSISVKTVSVKDAALDLSFDRPDLHIVIPSLTTEMHPDLRSKKFPFTFSVDRSTLIYDKKPLRDISLHGEGVSQGEKIVWERLVLGLAAGGITVSGTMSGFKNPLLDLRTRGDITLDTGKDILKEWIEKIPDLQGKTSWDISLSGAYPDISAQGSVSVSRGRLEKFILEDMQSTFTMNRERVKFSEVVFKNAGGTIKATGEIGLTGDMPVQAGVDMEGVSFARLLNNLTVARSKVEGTVATKASLAGTLRGESGFFLEGDADTHFKDFKVMKKGYLITEGNEDILRIKSPHAHSRVTIDKEKVHISSASVDTGAFTVLAEAYLRYNNTFTISFTSETMDISSLSPLAHLPIGGKGIVYGQIDGPFNNPLITGKADLSGASFLGWDLGAARGEVSYQALRLSFPDMRLIRGSTAYSCAAEVSFGETVRITVKVSVPKGRIEDIIGVWAQEYVVKTALKGNVAGDVTLEGPVTALDGTGIMTLTDASVLGESFSHGTASGRMQGGSLVVDGITLFKENGSLSLDGALSKNGELSAHLVSNGVALEEIDTIRRSHYPVSGLLSIDAHLGGMFRNPEGTGQFMVRKMTIAGETKEDSTFRVDLKDGVISSAGEIMGGEMALNTTTDLRSQGKYDVSLKMDGVNLTPFLWAINKDMRLGGLATGVLTLQGFLWGQGQRKSSGTIDLSSLEIREGVSQEEGYTIVNDGPVDIEWKEREWAFRSLTMKETGRTSGKFSLGGTLGEKTADMRMKASLDLYPLSLYFPSFIQTSEGRAEIDLSAQGPRTSPSLKGSLKLQDAAIQFKGLPARFEGIDVVAAARGNSIFVRSARGRVGKGEMIGRGLVRFSGLSPSLYDLSMDLKGLDIVFSREASALLDGSLWFHGPASQPVLSGDLTIREARVTQWKDWQALIWERIWKKYRGGIGVQDKGGTQLDVRLAADRGLHVKYGLAQAELRGKGTIVGTIRAPSFIGNLEFVKGSIYYWDNRFDITTGSINFSDSKEFVPVIDVAAVAVKKRVRDMRTASGEVKEFKDYRVLLHAFGRPENLKITMSSEPSDLSESEIYSVLAAGAIGGEEFGGLAIGKATAYGLGLAFIKDVGKAIGKEETEKTEELIGNLVDSIQLSPPSDAGTISPRITAVKSLGEYVELSASTETGGKGGGRFEARYTMSKRLSLLGGWDNDSAILMGNPDPVGNFGGDIVYTLRFR